MFRAGQVSPTAGWAPGFTQTNLIAVPADWAYEFLLFAQRNPKPCPVLDVSAAVELSGRVPAVHGARCTSATRNRCWSATWTRPSSGDAVTLSAGDVPMFWACGVTPQAAVMASRVPFAITHAPGAHVDH
jgi:uncharacterized protein YcsI (UPF0317 family)